MCGINGIITKDTSVLNETIRLMNKSLAHRGPDDEGVFLHNNIALGHRRLSIIDLSASGHQPMNYANDRFTIVYNGELYNFQEIRKELQELDNSFLFNTETDTEVILAAYSAWGTDCLKRFNGMFAFAIYDKQNNELFVARDRMGIKPFYYYASTGLFVFSSEIRALLNSGLVPRKLNQDGLADYFRYQTVHAPDTIVNNVFMLMPGHFGLYKPASYDFTVHCYWDITESVKNPNSEESYEGVCKKVNDLFTQSVKRRLIADVPFGAFLSGGIDSSAIVGVMSKVSNRKVKTFSVTFFEKEYSEEKYAKLIAEKFGTEHHDIKLSASDFKRELPFALKAMDHPGGDGPNSYVISKVTREAGITMALSGLGGDELFAGYDIFKRTKSLMSNAVLRNSPSAFRNLSAMLLRTMKTSVANDKIVEVLRQSKISIENSYPVSRQVLMDNQIEKLLNRDRLPANRVKQLAHSIVSKIKTKEHILSTVSLLEITTYMQNVLLRDADQMSMASALEVRVPFLDYNLVEYVLGLNDKTKYPHSPKKLLVDSLGDLLPKEIVNRPKMGFSFPWNRWMKEDLRTFCEERIYSFSKRSMINEKEVVNLWTRFLSDDKRITWSRIWYLVVLENWMIENKIEE